jgi:hypothetical protein
MVSNALFILFLQIDSLNISTWGRWFQGHVLFSIRRDRTIFFALKFFKLFGNKAVNDNTINLPQSRGPGQAASVASPGRARTAGVPPNAWTVLVPAAASPPCGTPLGMKYSSRRCLLKKAFQSIKPLFYTIIPGLHNGKPEQFNHSETNGSEQF